jgi:hypothetical protein
MTSYQPCRQRQCIASRADLCYNAAIAPRTTAPQVMAGRGKYHPKAVGLPATAASFGRSASVYE